MKKIKAGILFSIAILSAAALSAQTNTPPNFFQSIGSYFTSFNTNDLATFGQHKVQIATGVDSLQGNGTVPLANSLRVSYNLIQPDITSSNTTGFVLGPEEVTRNSGVAGTIVSQQLGFKAGFVVVDTEIDGYIDGGYNLFDNPNAGQKLYCEFGLRVQKALTVNTFAGIGIAEQAPINRQIGQVFAGFSF